MTVVLVVLHVCVVRSPCFSLLGMFMHHIMYWGTWFNERSISCDGTPVRKIDTQTGKLKKIPLHGNTSSSWYHSQKGVSDVTLWCSCIGLYWKCFGKLGEMLARDLMENTHFSNAVTLFEEHSHCDVMALAYFLHFWRFVWGTRRLPKKPINTDLWCLVWC